MTDRATVKHWTERSTDDFLYKVGADFVTQIEKVMDDNDVSQAQLASTLGVSKGRVSQILNNPGNLTLRNVVQYARALGQKVSIVSYDDGDAQNKRGLVNAEIFAACWDRLGKPADFFELREEVAVQQVHFVQAGGHCIAPEFAEGYFKAANLDDNILWALGLLGQSTAGQVTGVPSHG